MLFSLPLRWGQSLPSPKKTLDKLIEPKAWGNPHDLKLKITNRLRQVVLGRSPWNQLKITNRLRQVVLGRSPWNQLKITDRLRQVFFG